MNPDSVGNTLVVRLTVSPEVTVIRVRQESGSRPAAAAAPAAQKGARRDGSRRALIEGDL